MAIESASKGMPKDQLEHINQLIATITSEQTEFASVNVFELFSVESNQELFVDKLYLFKLKKDAPTIEVTQNKFEVLLIAFKCILESRAR